MSQDPDRTSAEGGELGDDAPLDPTLRLGEVTVPLPSREPNEDTATWTDAPEEKDPLDERGRIFAARFEVQSLLGEGGMGRVYHAKDLLAEGREVALKVLRPRFSGNKEFRDFFFKEIHAAQNFVSEHVVQVRDTGQSSDGELFLTMDLVGGSSLSQVLHRETSLLPRHALEIARQILLGLASGHERGFVHRDIKPSNVMLLDRVPKTEDNPFGVAVRVLDFGIAGMATDSIEGEMVGTPKYMSPEQVRGERLDARSDLFAVGIVMYEMISGQRPFEGKTLSEVTTAVLETDVRPLIEQLDRLPGPVVRILRRALQKDRAKRFQSTSEFIAAIESSSAFRAPSSVPAWAASGLVLLGLGAVAQGAWIFQQEDRIQELTQSGVVLAAGSAGDMSEAVAMARAEKEREYAGRLAEKDRALTSLEIQLNGLRELVNEKDELLRAAGDEGSLAKGLAEQLATLRLEKSELEEKFEKLKSRVQLIEDTNEPRAKMAACFDELLRRLEAGARDSAWTYLATQQDDGVFFKQNQDGRDLLVAVADLARRVDDLSYSALGAARRTLDEELPREMVSFVLESKDWIDFRAEGEDGASPRRRARLDAYIERVLRPAVEARGSELDQARLASWQEVADGPAFQDARRAIDLAEEFQADLSPLFERYVRAALDEVEAGGGLLDTQRLANLPELEVWIDWLEQGGSADAEAQSDLRRLHAARLWYGAGQRSQAFDPQRDGVSPANGEDGGWRARLTLQLALAAADVWPPPADATRLFCNRSSPAGQVTWIQDTVTDRKASSGSTQATLERRVYLGDGTYTGSPQSVELRRNGTIYLTGTDPLLDLRDASAATRVAVFTPTLLDRLPPRGSPLQLLDLADFAELLTRDPVPCLVVQRGATEFWLSARFGLVREVRPAFERELLYTNFTQ